jgi:undecaprenyl-diphosphatase
VLITIFIGTVSIKIFLELAEAVVEESPMLIRIDGFILDKFNIDFYPGLLGAMKVITFMGSWMFIVGLAGVFGVLLLFLPGKRLYLFHLVIVTLGSMGFNRLLKNYFNRERPLGPYEVEVIGHSYPSGHAMVSLAFYGLIMYFTWQFIGNIRHKIILTVLLMLLILAIGASRVYLGVHYPSDVVAGFAAGAFWLSLSLLTARAAETLFRRKRNNSVAPVDKEAAAD